MDAAAQREVIAFLSDPASHQGAPVERIETHISSLFLVGTRVFKLKKAVRLPFLDYTDPAERHRCCLAELARNRPNAPGLYLGVMALTRTPAGGITFDGPGPALDWVVVMRRFDEATRFDHLAAAGALDAPLLDGLTDAVVACHRRAEPCPGQGGVAALEEVISGNHAALLAAAAAGLDPMAIERLTAACRVALDRFGPRLERRRAEGRIRACHGDLHLGNLCLFEGQPTLFDAIEFREDYIAIDPFYDLAFLLMDLSQRGLAAGASRVLNRYLDWTGDYDGAPALPLFLALRATIRAHVTATIALAAPPEQQPALAAEARAYLAAAGAALIPPRLRCVAIGGLSGSGKSRLGRDLAPLLGVPGAVVVRSDALRKQLLGVAPGQRLGPEGYTPAVTEQTYQALGETCAALLAAGCPVIADAVFARPEQRHAIAVVAAATGVPFTGLWLEVDPDLAARRICARRPEWSDATPAVLAQQQNYDLGAISWTRIDSGQDKMATLAEARRHLRV